MGMYVGVRIRPDCISKYAGYSVCQIKNIDEDTATIILWKDTEEAIEIPKNFLQNHYGFTGSNEEYISSIQHYYDE